MRSIFCFALLFCTYSFSQTLTIKNEETGEPLESVSLIGHSPELILTTNIKGQVDITSLEGTKSIEIILVGFERQVVTYADLRDRQFMLEMEPLNISMDAVVISSTRWSQNQANVPTRITSIKRHETFLQNPQTTADLLGSSGEVFIQKSQMGGGSPMIRGFSTNRLLYSVDGVRMNTAIFRSGNIQNVISLDAFAMEGTEILFGPGSVIYGSDAIGGVMNFTTLTPRLSTFEKPLITGAAVTRYASASNEKTVHFDINVGWKKWALVTSITTNDFGDLKMGSYGPKEYLRPFYVQRQDSVDVIVTNPDQRVQNPTGYQQINMMQKIRFSPNEKWDVQYGFHYSTTSDYARYDRHIRYKNGLPRYGEWNYGPQIWMMNHISVNHTGQNKIYDVLSLHVAQQYFEESRISRDFNKPDRETRIEKVNAYSANLDLVKTLGEKHKLYYGIEYIMNQVDSKGIDENIETGARQVGPSRYPKSDWLSYGVYLNDEFVVSDKLVLQGGVRYNLFQLNATFDTTFYPFPFTEANISNGALIGSLGTVIRPTDKLAIRVNASTGFRSPNVDDVGKVFDSEPGAVVVPNPNLSAEYVYNAELGVTKIFGKVMKIDFTGYYTYLQNALVRRDYQLNGMDSIIYDGELSKVQAIQNAAFINVYGFQAGFELKFPSEFGISSRFNYQLGAEELDDGTTSPARHAAPWFGVTRIFYSTHNLNLQLYAFYSGEVSYNNLPFGEISKDYIYARDKNGNPYSPAWATLNFKAMYQFTNNFSVSAGLENITDVRYRPYSSGIVAPGRNFILSVRAIF